MKLSRNLFILMMVALLSGCASRMLYYPTKQVYGEPKHKFEKVTFPSRDGTVLTGWFVRAKRKVKGTVIHFHGNAQNMTAHYSFVSWLPDEGYNVFVFDYRGYGASEGSPDRKGVHADSCAALDYIRSRNDIDDNSLLVIGQSLGGANALAALSETGTDGVRAVVIDSTFYSYRLIVRDKMKHIPLVGLLRWPLSFLVISNAKSPSSTIDDIIPMPLIIFHGTGDRVIPYRHGQMLYKVARRPSRMTTIPNGRHTEAFVRRGSEYRNQLLDFFKKAIETPVVIQIKENKLENQTNKLITCLGAEKHDDRKHAQANLMAMGKDAIPYLKKRLDDPDPEVSTRARTILKALVEQFEKPSGKYRIHIVDQGEDLYTLAMMWAVRVSVIKNANGLTDNTPLFPGQKIKIPITEE